MYKHRFEPTDFGKEEIEAIAFEFIQMENKLKEMGQTITQMLYSLAMSEQTPEQREQGKNAYSSMVERYLAVESEYKVLWQSLNQKDGLEKMIRHYMDGLLKAGHCVTRELHSIISEHT